MRFVRDYLNQINKTIGFKASEQRKKEKWK